MEYKGYIGRFIFDVKRDLFLGKVSNIQALVTFESKSLKGLTQNFQDAVDSYLAWCRKHGTEPEKPHKTEISPKS